MRKVQSHLMRVSQNKTCFQFVCMALSEQEIRISTKRGMEEEGML